MFFSGYINGKFFSAKEKKWLSESPSEEAYRKWSENHRIGTEEKVNAFIKEHGKLAHRPLFIEEEEDFDKDNFLFQYYFL